MSYHETSAPPAYTTSQVPPFLNSTTLQNGSVEKPSMQAPSSAAPRFAENFGFYRSSSSSMVIARNANDPKPFFAITTHGSFSSQPSIVFHSNGSSSAPPLAFGELPSFSSSVEISLYPRRTPPSGSKMGPPNPKSSMVTLKSGGAFSRKHYFEFQLPNGAAAESFEWKDSKSPAVRSLKGGSSGMELTRVKTGELVIAWAPPREGTKKKGKMRFMAKDRSVYGDDFELLAVMTIIGLMEKGRRSRSGSSAAGAAASASSGGGGGGGGGGGC